MMDTISISALERARAALDVIDPATGRRVTRESPWLGLKPPEQRSLSFVDLLLDLQAGKLRGRWAEYHQELSRRFPNYHAGAVGHTAYIPPDALVPYAKRDMTAATASAGGYLVGTEIAGYVELARARSATARFGATELAGLVGSCVLTGIASGSTASSLPTEASPIPESTPQLRQIALTPKSLAASVDFSGQLLKQTSPQAQQLIVNDMLGAFGSRLDFLAIQGSGAAGQPTGILNTAGIGSVAGATIALAGILELQTDVGNRLSAQCGYVAPLATASLLAQRPKATGTSTFLWEGSLFEGVVQGYPAAASGNMPTATLLFGAWDQLVIASWGPLAIEFNPYSNFQANIVSARLIHMIDIALRDAGAFAAAGSVS